MAWQYRGSSCVSMLVATLFLVVAAGAPAAENRAPRRKGTKLPDLNGIWQAMNEAHWDVERHMARAGVQLRDGPAGPVPALPVMRLGAVAAVPPGIGVIAGGGRIPYTEAALRKKQENQDDWANRYPELK